MQSEIDKTNLEYIKKFTQYLNDLGYCCDRLLDSVGLSNDALTSPLTECSFTQRNQFKYRAVIQFDIKDMGLQFGRQFHALDYGILGYAFWSCANLKEAIDLTLPYLALIGSESTLQFKIKNNQATLYLKDSIHNGKYERFLIEEVFTNWLSLGAAFSAHPQWFEQVCLSFDEPEYSASYHSIFGCPIKYQQPQNKIVFNADLLYVPFTQANEMVALGCKKQCIELLQSLDKKHALIDNIHQLLEKTSNCVTSAPSIAAQLHLSERSLRRHLKQCGTSYQQLVTDYKMHKAARLLKDESINIDDIAHAVGYSGSNNFYRAFEKYYLQTPKQYRMGGFQQ